VVYPHVTDNSAVAQYGKIVLFYLCPQRLAPRSFLWRAARGTPATTTGSPNGGAGSRRRLKTAFEMPIRKCLYATVGTDCMGARMTLLHQALAEEASQ